MPSLEDAESNAVDGDRRGGRSKPRDTRQGNRLVEEEVNGLLAVLQGGTDTKGGGREKRLPSDQTGSLDEEDDDETEGG